MKILMIGLGSIGQRHLRNLRQLYGEENEILAYRVRGLQQTFSDNMTVREGVSVEDEFHIRVFSDLDRALSEKPKVAFITNITSEHLKCAERAVQAGCDIFLEKPVSDSLDGIEKFQKLIEKNKNIVYVGYQNRFHPCIMEAKKILGEQRIGNLISCDNEFSERLASMHSYEDYRGTYMARKDMGGGAMLNLQIHCMDYLQDLLGGAPESVYCKSGKNSGLDISVEDYASAIYCFKRKDGSTIPAYSHTDFLQYPPVHTLKLVGECGRVEIDMNTAETKIWEGDRPVETILHDGFKRNDMFLEELRVFMECVKNRKEPESNFTQGVIGLKMAIAAKLSAKNNKVIYLEDL